MKELSVEEKAKAYDEKLDVARHIYADPSVKDEDKYYIEVIFPELVESEDEKMRKVAIEACKYMVDNFENSTQRYEEALAWLEKQRPSGCPEYCVMSNCSNCPYRPIVVKQKPSDVSKQEPIDTTDLTDFEKCFKGMCCDKNQKFVKECCVSLLELARKQIQGEQKPEWSEEDEDNFKHLLDELVCLGNNRNSANRLYYDRLIKFIEELKNRAQPKEKWCDKDERMLDRLIAYFEKQVALTDDDNPRYANWLKSLRPQHRWKPSDEQIKVCKEVYADLLSAKGFDLGTVNGELNRLEEELKKLKEE